MTATTAPLPLPCFQAAGMPICRMCHWCLKQASLGKLLPSPAWPAPHSASIDWPLASSDASASSSCISSSGKIVATAS